jgi:hypothetical protein
LNDNGVLGEPADCGICDASMAGGLISGGTADPDGDGVAEDLIYVDCDGGSDQIDCGAPGKPPCATLTYALSTRVDGAGDGAEDIVCFRGTCSEPADLTPATSGVPGHRVKPASGSEEWDFQFPTNPAMLVGWDTDGDGSYPPFDPDDTAVMHGDPDEIDNDNGVTRAFRLNDGIDNSYFEMAHFTVKDYGRDDTDPHDAGFMKLNTGRSSSHLYLHDLRLLNINRDQQPASARSTFNWFAISDYQYLATFNWFAISDYQYLAFINIEALDNGSYFNRGAGTNGPQEAGRVRFQNLTYTGRSCDFDDSRGNPCADPNQAFVNVAKIWGFVSRFEWLDSSFDANVAHWVPATSGGLIGTGGIGPSQCAQDWVIRNNEFIDFKAVLTVKGTDRTACKKPGRPVTGIIFDRNLVREDSVSWQGGRAVSISGNGPNELQTTGSVVITNNIFAATAGWETVISIHTGNQKVPHEGEIVIVGNTFSADVGGRSAAVLHVQNQAVPFPQRSIVVRNNLFTGLGPRRLNVLTTYEPEAWSADFNVYDPMGTFSWQRSSPMGMRAWQEQSGGDAGSTRCRPGFVDPEGGDFHLLATDTCARGSGAVLDIEAIDFDGDPRPVGRPVDIGADQVADQAGPSSR